MQPQPQPTIESLQSGSMTYDGTEVSRIRIRNWLRDTFDDPGEPFEITFLASGREWATITMELEPGETIVRNPDNTYGIEVEANAFEGE